MFMNHVEQIINQMNEKAAKKCLYELARRLTQEEQEGFQQMLSDYSKLYEKQDESSGKKKPVRRMSQELVDEKMELFKSWIDDIENGELNFEADGYEDYSGDYWNNDWIWEYSDPKNIKGKISAILSFAKDCVNDYRYEEALTLYDMILDVCVGVDNEWDYFEVDLEEMVKEEILSIDLKELALLVLYTDYQVQKPNRRAEDLYAYFGYGFFKDVHIEDMFRMGREQLKEEEQFWQDWIEFLLEKTGDMEVRLLREALLYYKGAEGLVDIARKGYAKHPSLYLSAIREIEKNHDYERMQSVADEALERIGKELRIRGSVALRAGLAAYYSGNNEKAWNYWYETYLSDSTVQNYLRLFGWKDCTLVYGTHAKELLKSRKKSDHYLQKNEEMQENILDKETYIYLEFFAGEFDAVIKSCKNTSNSLGWSSGFIKKGIKLFLLYLYEGTELGESISSIADEFSHQFGFDHNTEGFCILEGNKNNRESNIFLRAFQDWKQYFPIDEVTKKKYLSWLEDLVDKRVRAIVGGKFNNHYGSVAGLVAALGEVKESLGEEGAKQTILLYYKKEFPRHSSFHGALRMQGGKF